MPKTIADKIALLKEHKSKLTARLNNLEAKARQEDRKRDTRRKIVVGAAVLAAMETDPALAVRVVQLLARAVTRDNDRSVIADLLGPEAAGAPLGGKRS